MAARKNIGKTKPFDPAAYLATPESQVEYMVAAMETGDAAFIQDAIGVVARAKGMTQIASEAGLRRESLYKALRADGNPEFSTILRVLQALNLSLTVRQNDGRESTTGGT